MAPRLVVSAQRLEAGQGGIGRVARLSVMALEERAGYARLPLQDDRVASASGMSRSSRATETERALSLRTVSWLWGVQRCCTILPGLRAQTCPALNCAAALRSGFMGYELWNQDSVRADYVAAVRRAGLILVNSNYTLSRVQATIGNLPEAKVCWLGTEQDEPAVQSRQDDIPRLLFLGRNDEMFAKGQDLLIDVWPDVVSKIPRAKLVFAGGGAHLPKLIELARASSAAANIDVLGFQSESGLENVWQGATAFAMLSCVEGFGVVFAEAMRHGVPILASDDDASQEVNVDEVTGFNVSRADRSGIIDRIAVLLAEPERADLMGKAGLERWRENFRFSVFQERLRKIVEPWLQS